MFAYPVKAITLRECSSFNWNLAETHDFMIFLYNLHVKFLVCFMILEHFDFATEKVSISLTFPVATFLGDLEETLIYQMFWASGKINAKTCQRWAEIAFWKQIPFLQHEDMVSSLMLHWLWAKWSFTVVVQGAAIFVYTSNRSYKAKEFQN